MLALLADMFDPLYIFYVDVLLDVVIEVKQNCIYENL